ncbi:peptidoglycan DD-metalloendopeptidase family protein [Streptomyces sp. NPDC088400]|uniref:peptidoglycan DD-metalloendopeptidase family protein n=1 Tax=Streptomyces sp. NPDC088400 TaxID=3365861 RepID=UPI0037FEBF4C
MITARIASLTLLASLFRSLFPRTGSLPVLLFALAPLALTLFGTSTAGAVDAAVGPDGRRVWPVGVRPVVLRGWEPPLSAYGPGHRGVDLAAAPGTSVRAAASGQVSHAGRVAGRGVLSITLPGTGTPPLRITYEPVEPLVAKGDEVTAGQVVGTRASAASSHCPASCLHWGLLRGETYLDPLSLLPPELLRRGPSRLLPVHGVPEPAAVMTPSVRTPSPPRAPTPATASAAGTALHALALLTVAVWAHRTGCRRAGRRT